MTNVFIYKYVIDDSMQLFMFNITILAVGKIKEKYFQEAMGEYLKRLRPYAKISIEELRAEPFKNESEKIKSKKIEGERIFNFLEKYTDSEIVILDERGKKYSSPEFADYLSKINRRIIFVIGGALGIDEIISKKYKNKIALSDMTFPHEMARVFLTEQLYRAAAIIKGKEYHY